MTDVHSLRSDLILWCAFDLLHLYQHPSGLKVDQTQGGGSWYGYSIEGIGRQAKARWPSINRPLILGSLPPLASRRWRVAESVDNRLKLGVRFCQLPLQVSFPIQCRPQR